MHKLIGYYNYTVILTYIGLCAGVIGVFIACGQNNTLGAVICLLAAGLCDAFDGKIASTMKRNEGEKKFGIQIDSLSDIVCFGVLPAAVCYSAGMKFTWCYVILALYVLCALIRLAYYNVTEESRQKQETGVRKYYIGLPVTASAIIFPFLFLIFSLAGATSEGYSYIIYSVVLAFTAAAFITPFRVKKLKMLGLVVIVLAGVALAAALIIYNSNLFMHIR